METTLTRRSFLGAALLACPSVAYLKAAATSGAMGLFKVIKETS